MNRFADLFSGIGGIRLAFENAGFDCVFSSEIDKNACETYFSNFHEYPSGDITKIKSQDIPDFEVLTGGFPCQPFSIAGLRKGFEDTRGTLFFEIERLLLEKKPKAFLLENVAGIVNHDHGRTLKVIEDRLELAGYVFSWKLMNAKDYGYPQNRNRWYCVGFRKDLNVLFNKVKNEKMKVFEFPQIRKLERLLNNLLEQNVPNAYRVSATALNNIQSHISKLKGTQINALAYDIRPSRCHFRNDEISPCLTAKMGTGGNNVPVLVREGRKLTERECLRLMDFPDSFVISTNSSHSYKQIGNSVVVGVVQLLAVEIYRLLNEE